MTQIPSGFLEELHVVNVRVVVLVALTRSNVEVARNLCCQERMSEWASELVHGT